MFSINGAVLGMDIRIHIVVEITLLTLALVHPFWLHTILYVLLHIYLSFPS